jgi:hypothetical protein
MFGGTLEDGSSSGCAEMNDSDYAFDLSYQMTSESIDFYPLYNNPSEDSRTYSSVYNNDAIGTGHARSMLYSLWYWAALTNDSDQWMTIDAGSDITIFGLVV